MFGLALGSLAARAESGGFSTLVRVLADCGTEYKVQLVHQDRYDLKLNTFTEKANVQIQDIDEATFQAALGLGAVSNPGPPRDTPAAKKAPFFN